jgi:hypothetical protein
MRYVDRVHAKQVVKVAKQIAMAIGAFTLLLAMSGCFSIPQRAWDNGRNISSSRAYRSMMHGDHSFKTMRQLYSSMDPYRSLYTPLPYPYFGHW